jgi:hypothetical protein
MERANNHRNRFILAALLILVGLGFTTIALLADYIGIGGPSGFGRNQIKLLLIGVPILAGGILLATPIGGRVILKLAGLTARDGKPLKAYQHLVIALWFGFLTGIAEAFVLAIRQNLLHQLIDLSKDVYWMTIFANLLFFGILGFLIFIIASLVPEFVPLSFTVFCSAFLSIIALMFLFQRINQIAALLLAIGVAIQVVRIVIRRSENFYAFITRSFAWICAVSALLVISMEVLL